MALHQHKKRAGETPAIPDRLYFKIGDVARICGVETYVLRFWETQFGQLKPNKSGTGQRLYRRNDVELALRIKQLVHEQGFTLAGARQALSGGAAGPRAVPAPVAVTAEAPVKDAEKTRAALAEIKSGLRAIAAMLAGPVGDVAAEAAAETVKAMPAEVPAVETPQIAEPAQVELDAEPAQKRRRARVTVMPSLMGSLFPLE